ncbi:MAG TPA: Rieske 2Fe-2S domain-containing protein [Candidatus Dormibacteraeota bacterium]
MAEPVTDRFLRSQGWLEPVADLIQRLVGGFYGALGGVGTALKDLLHGTKLLGHPLHPALTDMPLGLWTFGVIADLVALNSHLVPTAAGDLALLFGAVAGLGAGAAGYTDFHETFGMERRTAVFHGLLMTLVLLLDLVSLLLRWLGGSAANPLAVVIAVAALVVAAVGMFFGGHIVYSFGTMVDHLAFMTGPDEATEVGVPGDFPENSLKRVQAGDMPVLMVRLEGRLWAIPATCTHAGGPLDEGELSGAIVTCPWHGSEFDVRSGSVRHGPATFPEPALVVEEAGGKVRVRLAQPLH